MQLCLHFAAIIVVKYLFILYFKNPTAVQGDFWKVGGKQEAFEILAIPSLFCRYFLSFEAVQFL